MRLSLFLFNFLAITYNLMYNKRKPASQLSLCCCDQRGKNHDVRENKMHTERKKQTAFAEREAALQKELQRYKTAFYSEALLLADINISKDLIEEELAGPVNGEKQPLLPLVGLQAPCSFSEFAAAWAKRFVIPEDQAAFCDFLSLPHLQAHYDKGDIRLHIDYDSLSGAKAGERAAHRLTIFMYKAKNGDLIGQCTLRDITEHWKKEQLLQNALTEAQALNQRLLYVDELTGCANKKGFYAKAEQILRRNPHSSFGIYYSDINNLSYVNSTYGYEAGNQLLKYWSGCIQDTLSENEVLGRISGDYFATLLQIDDADRKAEIVNIHKQIVKKVNDFFKAFDPHFHVEIFCGIYLVMPGDLADLSIGRMLNKASIAHKNAKRRGSILAYYNEEQWEKRSRQIEICQHLSASLANGEIEAWLQPQYDCTNGCLVGAEVLCRWFSSFLGAISPAEFIPTLENSGQIYELDYSIWEQTCKYMRKWIDSGQKNMVPLSVNLSRRDILEEDLEAKLLGLLEKYRLTPQMLHLEITESAYMDEAEKLIGVVERLQALGFTIEMDDFGSGYSSLNMLKEVPVDILKMDLRFLAENGHSKKGGNIVSSIIRMAQGMNLLVIAEGVETEEQCTALRNMGCSLMQGYYFAKPMSPAQFEALLQTQETGRMHGKVVDTNLTYIYDILEANSNSSYIFNHYIGSGAIVEYDGEHIETMSMNDEFLAALGDHTGACRSHMKDTLNVFSEADRPKILKAVKKAVQTGRASCETYFPLTEQWVRLTYRHVVRGRSADYLFCEAVNTTEEHVLTAQVNNLSEEVNTQIDMLPTGAFRYEATGAQEFAFISHGMLALLKYPTVEAFQNKFHNNFPEMVYEEDRERVLREIDEQIEETGSLDYCEYRVETGDGKLKWVYDHGHLVKDANGKPWFYVVIGDLEQVRKGRRERKQADEK